MDFYDQISRHYDDIFPAGPEAVEFLNSTLGAPPKKLLDVACGTGNYSFALAQLGYMVTGIDASSSMVDSANLKAQAFAEGEVCFVTGDMRDLAGVGSTFDGAFCLGNSFVHLLQEEDMLRALGALYQKLVKYGRLVMQTVNYDRIFKFHVTELPTIKKQSAALTFERYYHFREDGLIDFNTVLTVPEGRFSNTVTLKPLLVGRLRNLLEDSGFVVEEVYGAFDGRMHEAESPATVVVAQRL